MLLPRRINQLHQKFVQICFRITLCIKVSVVGSDGLVEVLDDLFVSLGSKIQALQDAI